MSMIWLLSVVVGFLFVHGGNSLTKPDLKEVVVPMYEQQNRTKCNHTYEIPVQIGYRQFKLIDKELTYDQANAACTKQGYKLAVLYTERQKRAAKGIAKEFFWHHHKNDKDRGLQKDMWIGYKRVEDVQGNQSHRIYWKWNDNMASPTFNSDTDWYEHYVNDKGRKECAAIIATKTSVTSNDNNKNEANLGKLYNAKCTDKKRVLCSKKLKIQKHFYDQKLFEYSGCYKFVEKNPDLTKLLDVYHIHRGNSHLACRQQCRGYTYMFLFNNTGCGCVKKEKTEISKTILRPPQCCIKAKYGCPDQDSSETSQSCGTEKAGLLLRIRSYYESGLLMDKNDKNGTWTKWSEWHSCRGQKHHLCEMGRRKRYRHCIGRSGFAFDCLGNHKEVQPCVTPGCPTTGRWESWGCWSKCEKRNNRFEMERTRECAKKEKELYCTPEKGNTEVQECQPPRDCKLSRWKKSKCSVTCDSGVITSTRHIMQKAMYGGKECPNAPMVKLEACHKQNCPFTPNWCSWSSWGDCSADCGVGVKERHRYCSCPKPIPSSNLCVDGKGNQENYEMEQIKCSKTFCTNNDWGPWGECRFTMTQAGLSDCGPRRKTAHRNCVREKEHGNETLASCENTKSTICAAVSCKRDGNWNSWYNSNECKYNKTDDNGNDCGVKSCKFKRECNNLRPRSNGELCLGESSEWRVVDKDVECQVNGNWGEWGSWQRCADPCSKISHDYRKVRYRKCNNPKVEHGGFDCHGHSTMSTTEGCPQECKGEWSSWFCAQEICCNSLKVKVRLCKMKNSVTNALAALNEKAVPPVCEMVDTRGNIHLTSTQTRKESCKEEVKPIDGKWLPWEAWTKCAFKRCLNSKYYIGTTRRTRKCTDAKQKGRKCISNPAILAKDRWDVQDKICIAEKTQSKAAGNCQGYTVNKDDLAKTNILVGNSDDKLFHCKDPSNRKKEILIKEISETWTVEKLCGPS